MSHKNISRRTVAKGTAWSAPVVLTSAAAPAVAASPPLGANPSVMGASYFYDYFYDNTFTADTITAEIRPAQTTNASTCSYTVSGGPASVTNLSMTYWLPSPNFVFSSQMSSPWTTLKRDTTKASKVGPTTGITYYAYTTTYTGTGLTTTTCGPAYSFTAPAVNTNTQDPNGSYFYQFSYTLNGTPKINPLQSVKNP